MNITNIKVFLAGCLCFLTFSACTSGEKYVHAEGMIWNTMYHITYKGNENLRDSILPVLNEVSSSLSVFDSNSLVSLLNSSDSVKADPHLQRVYDYSVELHKRSDGAFDPTLSPLIDAWGFGRGHTLTADTMKVDSILAFVGIHQTRRDGEFIYKADSRTSFNFSAIAKGYGCDAVGEMFKRNGVTDYMVEIGGELALSGVNPNGVDWTISIDTPEEGNPGETSALIIKATNCGIATSGNYRNFHEVEGKRYAHTISAKTGRPFLGSILSATIVAPNCMEADAIATACMASEVDTAKKLVEESGVEAFFIFSDSVWMSSGFEDFVILESSEPGRKDRN